MDEAQTLEQIESLRGAMEFASYCFIEENSRDSADPEVIRMLCAIHSGLFAEVCELQEAVEDLHANAQ